MPSSYTLPAALRVALSLGIFAFGVTGYFLLGKADVEKKPPAGNDKITVETMSAEMHTGDLPFQVDGVVSPHRRLDVAAEVPGRIAFKSKRCRAGLMVKKDEVLARIDPQDYELEVERLQEELRKAEAEIAESEQEITNFVNQIALAKEELSIRQGELERYENAQDAVSPSELDAARRNHLTARNQLQTLQDQKALAEKRGVRLQSGMKLAQTKLKKAQVDYQRTEVRAPLDGVIVRENVEQGGYVAKGGAVFSLQETSRLDVVCKLHMRQMQWLWQSQAAAAIQSTEPLVEQSNAEQAYHFPSADVKVIYSVDGASFSWKGKLKRYDGAGVDQQTRMAPCRVLVEKPLESSPESNPAKTISPPTLLTGMFVKVLVFAQAPYPLLRLPIEAIRPGDLVWVVRGGLLRRAPIRQVHSSGPWVYVRQDEQSPQPGEEVVVSPLVGPLDGAQVAVAPKTIR